MTLEIHHRPEHQRFEAIVDGHRGVLEYTRSDNEVAMNSVRVPDEIGGRGVAGALTRRALDCARDNEWRVMPRCPYVRSWIERHPEYGDLVAE